MMKNNPFSNDNNNQPLRGETTTLITTALKVATRVVAAIKDVATKDVAAKNISVYDAKQSIALNIHLETCLKVNRENIITTVASRFKSASDNESQSLINILHGPGIIDFKWQALSDYMLEEELDSTGSPTDYHKNSSKAVYQAIVEVINTIAKARVARVTALKVSTPQILDNDKDQDSQSDGNVPMQDLSDAGPESKQKQEVITEHVSKNNDSGSDDDFNTYFSRMSYTSTLTNSN